MAGNTFAEYLDCIKQPFIKLCRIRFLNPDGSTAFALDNNVVKPQNKTFIADGTLTVNLQNGQRRNANIVLDNVNADYDFAYGKLWYGDEIALDEGVLLPNGTEFYIQQGVFLLDSPSESVMPNGRTINYTLVDKWANLDGSRMGNLEDTYEVDYGSNIFHPIAELLAEDRGNGIPLDNVAPIFTDYYNLMTQELPDGTTANLTDAPYTLTVDGGSTKADVILGLVAMVNGWVGYDASGALRVDASQDDISDATKPILWTFSQNDSTLLGLTYSANANDVFNDYIVVGEQLDDDTQPSARAQNYDPSSDTNINIIGKKTFREEASGYGTEEMCADLAVWKLKRATVLQKSVSISCTQLMHIKENDLVEIQRTDKVGNPIERHLIQGFSRPLADNSPMTINAISVVDYPHLTVTTDGGNGIYPVGEIYITANGTKDVSTYATAVVGLTQPHGTLKKKYTEPGNYVEDVTYYADMSVSVQTVQDEAEYGYDVRFYDYDGTFLYGYSKDEFLAMVNMPPNPDRTSEGLTAQGWNWTYSEAKQYVKAYGSLVIGQLYTTISGKTEIYISLGAQTSRRSPYLGLAVNGTAKINWGDGSSETTVTGTSLSTVLKRMHTYSGAVKKFKITVEVTSGSAAIVGTTTMYSQLLSGNVNAEPSVNTYYRNCITEIRLGENMGVANYGFKQCFSLETISVSKSTAWLGSSEVFRNCRELKCIIALAATRLLGTSTFYYCQSLKVVSIPQRVSVALNSSAFGYCYAMQEFNVPKTVTSLGSSAFSYSLGLQKVTLPEGITTIGSSAFSNCYSLPNITIPSTVTTINSNAFNNCYGLCEYHFKPTTPPTLANTNAFTNINTNCKMYVPYSDDHSILAAYQAAENWSTYSSYMVEEEEE